jgi:hypothetical protein
LEIRKAVKKMRMLFAHFEMYRVKMEEVQEEDNGNIDRPIPAREINKKQDEDFVYF